MNSDAAVGAVGAAEVQNAGNLLQSPKIGGGEGPAGLEGEDGVDAEPSSELCGRTLGDDLSVVDDDHPVAELLRLLHVVGREDHRLSSPLQLEDVLPEGVPGLGVQPRRRLVQVEDGRVGDQGPGHEKAALHAAGELVAVLFGMALQLRPL